jgi:hypothetical protein
MLDHLIDLVLHRFEVADLQRCHLILALSGAILSVYVMSLTSYEQEDRVDPKWLQWTRRVGHAMTALALLWSVNYMESHQWQPWPPLLLLILSVNITMAVRAIAIHCRIWREGRRRGAQPVPQRARSTLPF